MQDCLFYVFDKKKIIVVLKEESQIMKIKSVFHEKENKLFTGVTFFSALLVYAAEWKWRQWFFKAFSELKRILLTWSVHHYDTFRSLNRHIHVHHDKSNSRYLWIKYCFFLIFEFGTT